MPSRTKSIQQMATAYSKRQGIRFSKDEIEQLLRFYKVQLDQCSDKTTDTLDRSKFKDILHGFFHITDDIIIDRVFKAFDQDNDSAVSMDEWLKGLSVYLRGSFEDHVKFCFNVYDLNNDGHISREEMFQLLKTSMVKGNIEEDPDESVKDLVEIVIRMMGMDARLSLADYRKAVQQDSLLMEAFGQCLPKDEHVKSFMAAVDNCR